MTISDEEKNAILQTHSAFYNGYATGNVPSGPQPLRQDEGPNDTNGITINNRGEVGQYKNHLVNETVMSEEDKDWIQNVDMDEGDFTKYCKGEVTCDCVEKARKEGGKPEKQAQLFLNMNKDSEIPITQSSKPSNITAPSAKSKYLVLSIFVLNIQIFI